MALLPAAIEEAESKGIKTDVGESNCLGPRQKLHGAERMASQLSEKRFVAKRRAIVEEVLKLPSVHSLKEKLADICDSKAKPEDLEALLAGKITAYELVGLLKEAAKGAGMAWSGLEMTKCWARLEATIALHGLGEEAVLSREDWERECQEEAARKCAGITESTAPRQKPGKDKTAEDKKEYKVYCEHYPHLKERGQKPNWAAICTGLGPKEGPVLRELLMASKKNPNRDGVLKAFESPWAMPGEAKNRRLNTLVSQLRGLAQAQNKRLGRITALIPVEPELQGKGDATPGRKEHQRMQGEEAVWTEIRRLSAAGDTAGLKKYALEHNEQIKFAGRYPGKELEDIREILIAAKLDYGTVIPGVKSQTGEKTWNKSGIYEINQQAEMGLLAAEDIAPGCRPERLPSKRGPRSLMTQLWNKPDKPHEARTQHGGTILHTAVSAGSPRETQFWLENIPAEARTQTCNIKAAKGATALELCMATTTAVALLRNGAKPPEKDKINSHVAEAIRQINRARELAAASKKTPMEM